MISDIKQVYLELRDAMLEFNRVWPAEVETGVVWRLPLLKEQKALDRIDVERLDGEEAIRVAQQAFLAFEREPGQAPGTVMRLPGYFVLRTSVLQPLQTVNALKDRLTATIEQTRLELNLVPAARPKLMRQALGASFSTKQLTRHIQAFDGAPRLIVFTWAGHTAGAEKIPVRKVREQLEERARQQARDGGRSLEATPAFQELRAIVNYADEEHFLRYKKLAPHPRAMFWFSAATRYDAMVHANLPVMLLADPETRTKVNELKPFDRTVRQAERPDKKSRIEVIPRLNLYLKSPVAPRKAKAVPPGATVPSTYAR